MGAKQVAADTGEKVGPAGPELLKELRALRSLGRKMEGESRLLAANFASLRQRREALRGLCVDADARVPPLWLLLDNMRGLVLRRIYRPEACAAPLVLFYGADAGALAGAGYRLPRDVAQTWYARIHPADQAAYQAKEARRERRHEGYTVEYRFLHEQSGAYHWHARPRRRPIRRRRGYGSSTAASSTSPSRKRRSRRCDRARSATGPSSRISPSTSGGSMPTTG
jgi:hypothetical protein